MGLFARLLGRSDTGGGRPAAADARPAAGAQGRPRIDPAFGDAELAKLRAFVGVGSWPAARAILDAADGQEDLTLMVEAVADVPGAEVLVGKALEAAPDDPLLQLVQGARHVSWAWEARTRASARNVTEEQWKTFHERLESAEEHLYRAAELDPALLGPWYFLQISGRGASLDRNAARHRFEAALRRSPGHLASHRQRLQQLCEKWQGSHEQMHAFARRAMLAAPGGSPHGELVARAHIEHWLSLPPEEDAAYMGQEHVRAELHEAADRSVRHPDYVRGRDWAVTHNEFAMAFALSGQPAAAHLLFAELGDLATERPWSYWGDPAEVYQRTRLQCAGR
ncbi:hypothetical protein Kpho02_01050 [Kitasatospora phosalacinea]|uniref:DUF4034 domain-containing protein n=1 Tax=Kitasatospora phosalacinea TaxID=2065 RepID=A0A9W6Q3F0_9ACTN|nr:hypothetical protein [Kitasatospora phosalacinea]GLW67806.1 hypothetical protein Kpho02_01050 [Kitasatospora phosalacinea]